MTKAPPPFSIVAGIALSLAASPLSAQTDLESAEQAVELLLRAVAAHGGMEPITSAPGIEINLMGRYDLGTRFQGRTVDGEEWTPIAERISIDGESGTVTYDADFYNYALSHQQLREIHGDGPLFIDVRAGAGGYLPFTLTDDAKQRYRRYLPQLLLADALDQRVTLRAGQDTEFRGCDAHSADYATETGQRLTLYIERTTDLLCGASAVIMMPVLGDSQIDYRWDGYRSSEGIEVPSRFTSWLHDRVLKEADMTVRLAADPSAFAPPEGVEVGDPPERVGRLADFPPAGTRPIRLAEAVPGVHMIEGLRPGFRTPIIEFDDFLAVIDAPAGYYDIQQIPPLWGSPGDDIDALGEKILRAAEEVAPDKPIRYLVLTHHHSDHIGGLRPLVRAGATLVGTAPTLRAAERALAASQALGEDPLLPPLPEAQTEVFSQSRTISDGTTELRLIELPADNPKALGYTLAYLPQQRLLYSTGFIYPVGEGEPPPPESLVLANWFADWLDQSGLAIDAHYNVHAGGRIEQHHIDAVRAAAAAATDE